MKKKVISICIFVLAILSVIVLVTACNSENSGDECDHEWQKATCETSKTCKLCNKTSGEPLGHDIVIDEAVPANCIQEGITEGKHCGRCNKILVTPTSLPKNEEHDFSEWDVIKKVTCSHNGKQKRICSLCGFVETQNIVTEGHNIEHGKCTKCNVIINAQDVLAYYVLQNGTLTNDGKLYYLGYLNRSDNGDFGYFIYTDANASLLQFGFMYKTDDIGTDYMGMNLNYNSTIQDVWYIQEYLNGERDYSSGKIDMSRFSSSNKNIYDFVYDYSSVNMYDSALKLFGMSINMMLLNIGNNIIDYYNIGITMKMLGFANY